LKKFTLEEEDEYKKISEEVQNQVSKEFDIQIDMKNTELKKLKDKDDKKIIKSEITDLENKKEEKIKKLVKERFNYEIAIAEVQKA